MSYKIKHLPSHIEINTSGTMNFFSIKAMVKEVADSVSLTETETTNYLFNFNQTSVDVNPFETCALFDLVNELNINSGLKIAFVYVAGNHDHRHAENVGINRGFRIRGFQHYNDAIFWLNQNNGNNIQKIPQP